MRESKKNKYIKNKSASKKYISIVCIIVAAYLVFAAAGVFVFGKINGNNAEPVIDSTSKEPRETTLVNIDENTREQTNKRKINIAVFGVDEDGYRTDVIFAVSFDTETKKLSLVAVPRDTKVKMPTSMMQDMVDRGRSNFIPYQLGEKGVCKINEIHAYAGEGYRNKYSVWMLKELLDVDFDYYINVNIEGFKSIVDAVGGVEVTVEQRLQYYDPAADFRVDLYPGTQTLNGEKAEQLVRFRKGYAQQDLKRIQVQQDFLKALMRKIMNTDTLVSNMPALIKTFFKYVDTDLTLTDALKYVKYLKGINVDDIYNTTIPGTGGSYFTVDETALRSLIEDVFYDVEAETPDAEDNSQTEDKPSDSKNLIIEVANGGNVNGLAAKKQSMLKEKGYKAEYISTYDGDRTDETRIFVREEGIGDDLKALFPDSIIVVDNGSVVVNGTDIKIVLGLNEK